MTPWGTRNRWLAAGGWQFFPPTMQTSAKLSFFNGKKISYQLQRIYGARQYQFISSKHLTDVHIFAVNEKPGPCKSIDEHKDHPIGNKHSLYIDSIINTWGSMSCFTTQQGPNMSTREEARTEGDWFKSYENGMELKQ